MTKPVLFKQTETLTDDAGSFSGNIFGAGKSFDADGDTLTVANVDGARVDGVIGAGGKVPASNTFAGDFGTLTIFQDGSYEYKLNPGLNLGSGDSIVEDFAIKIRDNTGLFASNVLKFVINGTDNNKPVAVDDIYLTNSPVLGGNLLANDSDPDGDTLHIGGVQVDGINYHITGKGNVTIDTAHGSLEINDTGAFTFTADNPDESFVETFSYKPHDGQSGEGNNTDFAVVTITHDALTA